MEIFVVIKTRLCGNLRSVGELVSSLLLVDLVSNIWHYLPEMEVFTHAVCVCCVPHPQRTRSHSCTSPTSTPSRPPWCLLTKTRSSKSSSLSHTGLWTCWNPTLAADTGSPAQRTNCWATALFILFCNSFEWLKCSFACLPNSQEYLPFQSCFWVHSTSFL